MPLRFNLFSMLFMSLMLASVSLNNHAADKKIGILVFDDVLTSDITAPAEVFGAASKQSWFTNYEVIMINIERKDYITTEEGLRLKTQANIFNDIDLDVLLVPSAYTMKPLLKNKDLIKFVKSQSDRVSWIASNCSGAFILAEAGVLKGRRATTWAGGEKELQQSYPDVKVVFNQNFVTDGNIITSNGGAVSYEAAVFLLSKLSSTRRSQSIYEALQIHRLEGSGFNLAQKSF